jgi:hypothetical protein
VAGGDGVLSAAGQGVWDLLAETRGSNIETAQGGVRGPFNAFVHAPDVGGTLTSLGGTPFGSSLGPRLKCQQAERGT